MIEEKFSMEDVVKHVEQSQKGERIVTGTIIEINKDKGIVIVDIGSKSEGLVQLHEFTGKEINIGDELEVFIVKKSYDSQPVLSYKRAQQEQYIVNIELAFKDENTKITISFKSITVLAGH